MIFLSKFLNKLRYDLYFCSLPEVVAAFSIDRIQSVYLAFDFF